MMLLPTMLVYALLNKVISLDMMAPAGPKPDAGNIVEPKPTAFGLPGRHLQTFLAPDARHTLGVYMPTLSTEQGCNPAIAVAPTLAIHPAASSSVR